MMQTVSRCATLSYASVFTFTVTCDDDVHPSKSPVTVYVVVEEGVAVIFDAVEELNVEDGLQAYVLAPVTLSGMDCPVHIVSSGESESRGSGFTVTVTCCVAVQPSEFPVTV